MKILYTSLAVFTWLVAMGLYTGVIVEALVNKGEDKPGPAWKLLILCLTISQVVAGAYWWVKAVRLP